MPRTLLGTYPLRIAPNPPIEPIRIIQLVQKDRNFKLAGQDRLLWKRSSGDLDAHVAGVRELMKKLAG